MEFQEWLSVDKSVIPYYGWHGRKRFIRNKPIRFGYKQWSLASSSGYMYHMKPYGGSHSLLPDSGLGQGPSVVLGLAEVASFHDNLFISLALLNKMTKKKKIRAFLHNIATVNIALKYKLKCYKKVTILMFQYMLYWSINITMYGMLLVCKAFFFCLFFLSLLSEFILGKPWPNG